MDDEEKGESGYLEAYSLARCSLLACDLPQDLSEAVYGIHDNYEGESHDQGWSNMRYLLHRLSSVCSLAKFETPRLLHEASIVQKYIVGMDTRKDDTNDADQKVKSQFNFFPARCNVL